jgi:hypothetical protein
MNAAALSYISTLRLDPHPPSTLDYSICRTPIQVHDYFYGHLWGNYPELALDTESTPDHRPYCVTFSIQPGTGRLIYTRDRASLAALKEMCAIATPTAPLLFHNYLHDVHPFSILGLPIPHFRDTMVLAYLACLGGGGSDDESGMAGRGSLSLKSLAYRHCNIKMTSFRDTVYPNSAPKLAAYLESLVSSIGTGPEGPVCLCGCPRDAHNARGATGKLKGACTTPSCPCAHYKLHNPKKDATDRLLGLLLRKTNNLLAGISTTTQYSYLGDDEDDTDPSTVDEDSIYGVNSRWKDEEFDPFKRVRNWHRHDHEMMRMLVGEWPRPSIADVPEGDLVQYAVRDADATLRLYQFLRNYYPWLFY